jgi:hypothetical protein
MADGSGSVEVLCPCGETFKAWRNQVVKGGGKYCSKPCRYRYQVHRSSVQDELEANGFTAKTCARCKVPQSLDQFPTKKSGAGYYSYCRSCNNAQMAAWRAANPGRATQRAREWRWLKRFGITPEQYMQMLAGQDNACAICRSPESGTPNGWFDVDHCHETDKVRGLLCRWCNLGIGQMGDNAERLRAAADYLDRS